MARFPVFHSYIGIQPARGGAMLHHSDQAVGINYIAVWARSRAEVQGFYREFLTTRGIRVTDQPKEYPPLLTRLLRRVLRRPDQRHPLGTGAHTDDSISWRALEVASCARQIRIGPPGVDALRSSAGLANAVVPASVLILEVLATDRWSIPGSEIIDNSPKQRSRIPSRPCRSLQRMVVVSQRK